MADAQPGGQPDVPIHGFDLASVRAARRLPYSLGVSVVVSQLRKEQCVALDLVDHAVLFGDAA